MNANSRKIVVILGVVAVVLLVALFVLFPSIKEGVFGKAIDVGPIAGDTTLLWEQTYSSGSADIAPFVVGDATYLITNDETGSYLHTINPSTGDSINSCFIRADKVIGSPAHHAEEDNLFVPLENGIVRIVGLSDRSAVGNCDALDIALSHGAINPTTSIVMYGDTFIVGSTRGVHKINVYPVPGYPVTYTDVAYGTSGFVSSTPAISPSSNGDYLIFVVQMPNSRELYSINIDDMTLVTAGTQGIHHIISLDSNVVAPITVYSSTVAGVNDYNLVIIGTVNEQIYFFEQARSGGMLFISRPTNQNVGPVMVPGASFISEAVVVDTTTTSAKLYLASAGTDKKLYFGTIAFLPGKHSQIIFTPTDSDYHYSSSTPIYAAPLVALDGTIYISRTDKVVALKGGPPTYPGTPWKNTLWSVPSTINHNPSTSPSLLANDDILYVAGGDEGKLLAFGTPLFSAPQPEEEPEPVPPAEPEEEPEPAPPEPEPTAVCGNSIIEEGEFCDDGSINCEVNGYNGIQNCGNECLGYGDCLLAESCGDSLINGNEECDDGNLIDNDGCSSLCLTEEPAPAEDIPECTTNTDCDDSISCTDNVCVEGTCTYPISANRCLIDGVCQIRNNLNPANQCQQCNPESDTAAWTNNDALYCSDNDPSTTGDHCSAGVCVGTSPIEICTDSIDNDGDSLVDCADSDCVADTSCIVEPEPAPIPEATVEWPEECVTGELYVNGVCVDTGASEDNTNLLNEIVTIWNNDNNLLQKMSEIAYVLRN
jgi:cysteine-rich repeat protein